MRHLTGLAIAVFILVLAAPAFSQTASGISPVGTLNIGPTVSTQTGQAPSVAPDDRYVGYPSGIPIVWPNMLPDLAVCQALEYYQPADTHLKRYVNRVKVAGRRIQEHPECAWMLTRYGWRYVMRPAGTIVLVDAQGRDLFDDACANPRPISIAIAPPEPPRTVEIRIVVTKPDPPAPEPVRVAPPASTPQPPPPPPPSAPMPEPEEEGARFGVTASATPRFSTSPVNGFVSSALGKDAVCVDGYALDVGLAWGKSRGSFVRLAFDYKSIEEGSSSRIVCEECNATEVLRVQEFFGAVRQYGFAAEAILRLPVGKSWLVQPMISIRGGVGVWSGQVSDQILRPNGSEGTVADAKRLLGTNTFGGVGAGLVGGNDRWTVTGAGVLESPTGLGGRFALTRWF